MQKIHKHEQNNRKIESFGKEECDIAAVIDEIIRNAISSFASNHGASLKMKMLVVKKLNMLVSVMSVKKAKGEFMSTPQPWHCDHHPNIIKKNEAT